MNTFSGTTPCGMPPTDLRFCDPSICTLVLNAWVGGWVSESQALPAGTCVCRGGGRLVGQGGPGLLVNVCAVSTVGVTGQFCLGGHMGHQCLHRRGSLWVNMFNEKNGPREAYQDRSLHWVTDWQVTYKSVCMCMCVCVYIFILRHEKPGLACGGWDGYNPHSPSHQHLRSMSLCPWPLQSCFSSSVKCAASISYSPSVN